MPQELPGALHPPVDALPPHPQRRTAVWPWLLMPLVALALFLILERLRHAAESSAGAPAGSAASDSSSDDP